MFDFFSWSHILILLTAALVIVGPKDLPRLMHMAGKWAGKARGMANEFRRSFDEMARASELEELRKELEALKRNNPVADLQAEINRPLETAAEVPPDAPPDGESAAPRSGEFAITEDAPAPAEAGVQAEAKSAEPHPP